MNCPRILTALSAVAAVLPVTTLAADVLPTIGGGQVTMSSGAPMKHAGVSFDGTALHVHLDEAVTMPTLRILTEPDQFAASEAWSVLDGTHHNFQHGWVPEGICGRPPTDTAVWIEQPNATPGLDVFEGGRFMSETTIRAMTFDPIFGTNGSPQIWQWGGIMTHNAYAVANPSLDQYVASYRVYIGDSSTGAEILDAAGAAMYGSDTVTFGFSVASVPEPTATSALMIGLVAVCTSVRRKRRS